MLTLPSSVRVYMCTKVTDMRKGFDGLSALASDVVRLNPLSGHYFVFRNRSGNKLKVLYWGGDGLCLWYKRLERGTFELPKGGLDSVEITSTELYMLIDGVALASPRRKRFSIARAA